MQNLSEILLSTLVPIFGVLFGAFLAYLASYTLEKRKWEASAAIARKDTIYSPIHGELGAYMNSLQSLRSFGWSSLRPRLDEWQRRREGVEAVMIPQPLATRLDALLELSTRYSDARQPLVDRLQHEFPEKHVDWDDNVVAIILAESMLIGIDDDVSVLRYLKEQRPASPDASSYWTSDRLEAVRNTIRALDEWSALHRAHTIYIEAIRGTHKDLEDRMKRIVRAFQRPRSKY